MRPAPAAFSLDHIGPMAWTAEDCAIMLQVLAPRDSADPASALQPIRDDRAALNGSHTGSPALSALFASTQGAVPH
jgi:aspartyl-tRNA(Asn)/glutamyl-tRNA(Gln) amidotransferase subunit A